MGCRQGCLGYGYGRRASKNFSCNCAKIPSHRKKGGQLKKGGADRRQDISIFYHINIAVREDESECWLSTQAVVHIKVFF